MSDDPLGTLAKNVLQRKLDEHSELESIVRDLADAGSVASSEGTCGICGSRWYTCHGDHEADCAYRRADKWVRERDAEKGEG
jgi:hypothetical protein